jgi:cell division transport system permease protein
VYLDMEVGETRAAELANEIAERSDVAATSLISRAQALAEFRVQSGFGEALDALQENPLPHTLVVRPAFTDVARVQALAGDLDTLQETALVQIDTEWVARLQSMLGLAARIVDIATALLGLAVVLVIGNTIRLEINNRRIEIEVMKLVGGSDGFIRRPFLYLGFCYGLAGAATAAILIFVALALIRAPVRELAELYASTYRLAGLSARETFVLLGGGAVLGWLGAWLAAARHLRQIEPS